MKDKLLVYSPGVGCQINFELSDPYFVDLHNFLRLLNYQMTSPEHKFNSLSPSLQSDVE